MVKTAKNLGSNIARKASHPIATIRKSIMSMVHPYAALKDRSCFKSEKDELTYMYQKLRDIIPATRQRSVSNIDIVLNAARYIQELHSELDKISPGIISGEKSNKGQRLPLTLINANSSEK